jgi:hypothetical protein
LCFASVQLFFAIVYAKSQSMMADCAAMYVDAFTYFVNFLAERSKHGHSQMSPRQLRLHRLYLELIPPLFSVITLMAVTVTTLQKSIETLIHEEVSLSQKQNAIDENDNEKDDRDDDDPDLRIMMIFSGLNLILDVVNVGYFVQADQAVGIGLPNQHGEQHIHVEYEHSCSHEHFHHHQHHGTTNAADKQQQRQHATTAVATEESPLVAATLEDKTITDYDDDDDNDSCASEECESSSESSSTSIRRNLNMCSAWTVRS